MTVKIVRDLPEEKWREFVDNHPQGNIFHTPDMFQVYKLTQGYLPELWAAIDRDRVLALMLPVQVSVFSNHFPRLTGRAIVYGSVLYNPDAEGLHALPILLQEYQRVAGKRSLYTELRNLFPMDEIQPLLNRHGFEYADHLNYLIDINRSPDDIFQSIGKRTRKNIRSGLNQGKVNVEEVTRREDIDTCYELIKRSYKAAKVPLADRSLFMAAFDILYPLGMIRFTIARIGDVTAAVSVELLYKDAIYGWFSGIDRSYGSFSPNELIMWDILKWGADNGYHIYDFGGAGTPGEEYGVRDFKAKFGGMLVCFGRNIWIPNRLLLQLSKAGYAITRQFLR